ncbi:MAG: hypothetical protein HXX16_03615 [Bacteroidales bacterium]|nr:hypothetical protein [Bacteroidales bacterium]
MVKENTILKKPLSHFALSDEFLEMARINRFNNLGEITKVPVSKLLKLPYFGYRVLNELITILKYYDVDSVLSDD